MEKQIELIHIQPGIPAQNTYIECFTWTYREDVLEVYLFEDLQDVRPITELSKNIASSILCS
jgi:putative transposase